jgi:histone H3/H4
VWPVASGVDLTTSSLNPRQKLRIDDLTNRAMMLADVAGRVSLMKRDLAELMRALRAVHQ